VRPQFSGDDLSLYDGRKTKYLHRLGIGEGK